MKGLLCRWLGHRWATVTWSWGQTYTCARCGEPGFWVPEGER